MKLILGSIKTLPAINKETSKGENKSRFLNKKGNQKVIKSTLNYDDEKLLILLVQERRSLWDFSIPLDVNE